MTKNFSGTNVSELCRGHDNWNFYIPPISPSKYHSVLYEFPLNIGVTPQPHISKNPKHWNDDYVKMPFSSQNLYIKDDEKILKPRWEIICEVLSEPIKSYNELEEVIKTYSSISKLPALEHFLNEVLSEDESIEFFENLLPKIIELALRLPELFPCDIPLLKKHLNKSISMSQLQISSILANAFLCTFPWRKEVANSYPGINFVRIFSAHSRPKRVSSISEKLKCLIHYFRRVTSTEPKGVVTFERIFIPKNKIPRWDDLHNNLGNTRVHINSFGRIEDSPGFLQVDFANKNVGGGVLGYGCVQEEIRYVICPELIVTRLFVEQLGDTESVIVRGIERFSKYTGYGDTFKWDGNFIDETPCDNYGRKQTSVSIIDATRFFKIDQQFYPNAILRELGKAYAGFYSYHTKNLAPVATGNWGCGAFHGEPNLKTLIQLIACNATNRDLVYYTFGDDKLQETFHNMYLFIATNKITICELWRIFCKFAESKLPSSQFYCFIQQSFFDSRNNSEPQNPRNYTIKESNANSTKQNQNIPTTSKLDRKPEEKSIENLSQASSSSSISFDDIIPSSQPEVDYHKTFTKFKKKKDFDTKLFEKNHSEILDIFSKIDAPPINKNNNEGKSDTLLSVVDKFDKKIEEQDETVLNQDDNSMDIDTNLEESTSQVTKSKNRITDYFSKLSKS